MRSPRAILCLSTLLGLQSASACNLNNLGDPPPDADIYFPTGLALSGQSADSASRFLYVINANFDLRYNRGSVQAFDLDALDSKIAACVDQGFSCQILPQDVLVDEVLIPSLASAFSLSLDRRRMYVATRTDRSLLYIDLDESAEGEAVLRCDESDRRCSDDRRRGADASANPRGVILPAEPVGMTTLHAVDAAPGLSVDSVPGDFVLIAHRYGQVSLFYDPGSSGPQLVDVVDQLPQEPTAITFDPIEHRAYLSIFARGTASGLPRILSRVAISVGESSDGGPQTSYVYDAGSVVIDGVAAYRDTRALRLNPAREAELLVTGEQPAALIFVDLAGSSRAATRLPAKQIVPVGAGPYRMTLGKLGDRDLVAVSCFDGRQLYLVDALSGDVVGVIHNLNGPFDVAIDAARKRLYLADFRSSSIQVIDLTAVAAQGANERTDAPITGVLGIPKVVQELQ